MSSRPIRKSRSPKRLSPNMDDRNPYHDEIIFDANNVEIIDDDKSEDYVPVVKNMLSQSMHMSKHTKYLLV